jgi:glycosyltransferase involved in cell wall biosynthesis
MERLARDCDIDVIQLVTPWASPMQPDADGGVLRRFDTIEVPETVPPMSRRVLARARTALLPSPPHPVYSFHSGHVRRSLRRLLDGRSYDTALWVTGRHVWVGLPILRRHAERVILDGIDSRYSHDLKEAGNSPLARWDLFWLRRWELATARRFDEAAYISQSDIELLERGLPQGERVLLHLPNGVLFDDFDSERAKVPDIEPGDFVLGYLGNMAYGPNIQAATRAARILEAVKPRVPRARLLIIGRSPAPEVRELGERAGVTVTGTVDRIWPYLNRADVFVFPLDAGAGQQNKVMEAMFAGKPVVSTPMANNGIGAEDGKEILIAASDVEIRRQVERLHASPDLREEVGSAGHRFVRERYTWSAILPRFHRFCFPGAGDRGQEGQESSEDSWSGEAEAV